MRDWIGTGVTLLGFALVVVTLVQMVRARGSSRDARPGLLRMCAGLVTIQAGQLVRAPSWTWTILHLVAIVVVAAGALSIHRDLRRTRRDGARSDTV